MKDIVAKLKSDRLWALGMFIALVVANVKAELGLTDDQLKDVMWAVIAFIGGKSIRGSQSGAIIEALAPKAIATLEAIAASNEPVKPEDVPPA